MSASTIPQIPGLSNSLLLTITTSPCSGLLKASRKGLTFWALLGSLTLSLTGPPDCIRSSPMQLSPPRREFRTP